MNMDRDETRHEVLQRIEREDVKMRPRWHFALYSTFGLIGSLIVFLTAIYVVSLIVFFLQRSGAWYAPSFGGRGWVSLLSDLPWVLLMLVAVFTVLLEVLVRKYSFVYRKPLALSLAGIVIIAVGGGFLLASTPLHGTIYVMVKKGDVPPPVGLWYRGSMHPQGADVYRGYVASTSPYGLVIYDADGAGTTTVVLSRKTRYPYGAEFGKGDLVVVIGDTVDEGVVQAFGVRAISH